MSRSDEERFTSIATWAWKEPCTCRQMETAPTQPVALGSRESQNGIRLVAKLEVISSTRNTHHAGSPRGKTMNRHPDGRGFFRIQPDDCGVTDGLGFGMVSGVKFFNDQVKLSTHSQ